MKPHYIFDTSRKRQLYIDRLNTCDVASRLRLFHGPNFSEEDIRKLWVHKSISPSYHKIRKIISVKNIKWYINTHTDEVMKCSEWNPDFLMGMLQWGRIYYNSVNFPAFWWYGNSNLLLAIKSSPFAGTLNADHLKPGDRFIWSDVPALCLKYSTNSIEYMAGVLSAGIIESIKDVVYARYNPRVGRTLERWGIPIEHRTKRWIYISPFWTVILQNYMPQQIRNRWIAIPHACRASEYSSILWKIHTGKDPIARKMPYLMSRRMVFYKYGSMRALRDLWVSNHLVNLDSRFKKVVQDWQQKFV